MEHRNPLLVGNDTENRFMTIGEVMLRLTPPNYEKVRMASSFEARNQYSPCAIPLSWPWRTWGLTVHFLRWCRTTVWEKVRFVCSEAATYTALR